MFPEEPVPTMAVIVLEFIKENDDDAVPPKLTDVAPVKLEPERITVVPEEALVGLKDVMVGLRAIHSVLMLPMKSPLLFPIPIDTGITDEIECVDVLRIIRLLGEYVSI